MVCRWREPTDKALYEEHDSDMVDEDRPEGAVDTPPEQSEEKPVGWVFSRDDIARLADMAARKAVEDFEHEELEEAASHIQPRPGEDTPP